MILEHTNLRIEIINKYKFIIIWLLISILPSNSFAGEVGCRLEFTGEITDTNYLNIGKASFGIFSLSKCERELSVSGNLTTKGQFFIHPPNVTYYASKSKGGPWEEFPTVIGTFMMPMAKLSLRKNAIAWILVQLPTPEDNEYFKFKVSANNGAETIYSNVFTLSK